MALSINGPDADELCGTCEHPRSRHIDRTGVDSDELCDEDGCARLEWVAASPDATRTRTVPRPT